MGQFSLKRFYVSITLIAIGLAIEVWVLKMVLSNNPPAEHWFDALFFSSGPLISAGLLCPFRRTKLGVFAGACLQIVLCLALLSWQLNRE